MHKKRKKAVRMEKGYDSLLKSMENASIKRNIFFPRLQKITKELKKRVEKLDQIQKITIPKKYLLQNPILTMVVVGTMKSGKSSIINQILNGREVCPVETFSMTKSIWIVRYGNVPRIIRERENEKLKDSNRRFQEFEDPEWVENEEEFPDFESKLYDFVYKLRKIEGFNKGYTPRVFVEINIDILKGFCIVDTPGMNEREDFNQFTLDFCSSADLVLYVSSCHKGHFNEEDRIIVRRLLEHIDGGEIPLWERFVLVGNHADQLFTERRLHRERKVASTVLEKVKNEMWEKVNSVDLFNKRIPKESVFLTFGGAKETIISKTIDFSCELDRFLSFIVHKRNYIHFQMPVSKTYNNVFHTVKSYASELFNTKNQIKNYEREIKSIEDLDPEIRERIESIQKDLLEELSLCIKDVFSKRRKEIEEEVIESEFSDSEINRWTLMDSRRKEKAHEIIVLKLRRTLLNLLSDAYARAVADYARIVSQNLTKYFSTALKMDNRRILSPIISEGFPKAFLAPLPFFVAYKLWDITKEMNLSRRLVLNAAVLTVSALGMFALFKNKRLDKEWRKKVFDRYFEGIDQKDIENKLKRQFKEETDSFKEVLIGEIRNRIEQATEAKNLESKQLVEQYFEDLTNAQVSLMTLSHDIFYDDCVRAVQHEEDEVELDGTRTCVVKCAVLEYANSSIDIIMKTLRVPDSKEIEKKCFREIFLMEKVEFIDLLSCHYDINSRKLTLFQKKYEATLADVIEDEAVALEERIQYAIHLCKILEECHKYYAVHRDIRPETIMLDMQSEEPKVAISDFGIIKELEPINILESFKTMCPISVLQVMFGKPLPISNTYDVYSMGIVLTQLWEQKRNVEAVIDMYIIKKIQDYGHNYVIKLQEGCGNLLRPLKRDYGLKNKYIQTQYQSLCQICASVNVKKRPTFVEVIATLTRILGLIQREREIFVDDEPINIQYKKII